MKLYGISGLGADKRVFQYLDLKYPITPIDWIEPIKNESLKAYANRLASVIDTSNKFGIIGVSFGGLIAMEISKTLNPKITILISSAETKNELRPIYRLIGKSGLMKLVPAFLFNPPRKLAHWLFGAKDKKLLNAILDTSDSKFVKWSVLALTSWDNEEELNSPLIKIGSTKDKLIPAQSKDSFVPKENEEHLIIEDDLQEIKNGEHFMIVDRAKEISESINYYLKSM